MKTQRDVIVIGAGMAGLLTAYFLQKEGRDVLVLEANEVASGQTGRTTAKITSQHGLKYAKLIKQVGKKRALMYAQANEQAISEYERLVRELDIDCDFRRTNAFLYTTSQEWLLEKEYKATRLLGIDSFLTTDTELPFFISGALGFRNQAQFLPHPFIKRISQELEILEHTKVKKVCRHLVMTEDGFYTAEHIVIATHYPIVNAPGFYFARQHRERSYVLKLSNCRPIKNMYYSIDEHGLSFRQAGDFLILGGGAHRTGKNKPVSSYDFLSHARDTYFPQSEIVDKWSAQDCMPHDGIPFIGKYSVIHPNWYVATGFQKWGMTTSMIAARIISDAICGRAPLYAKVFSPQRFLLRASFKDAFLDSLISVKSLVCGAFCRKSPRCSHLGCKLVWNPNEQTWDCPCHDSRYTENGAILDNPTKKRL